MLSFSGRLVASASLLAISSSAAAGSPSCQGRGAAGGRISSYLSEQKGGATNFAWIMVGKGLRPEGGVGWLGSSEHLAVQMTTRGAGCSTAPATMAISLVSGPASSSRSSLWLPLRDNGGATSSERSLRSARAPFALKASEAEQGGDKQRGVEVDDKHGWYSGEEDEALPKGQGFNEWFAGALLDTEVFSLLTYPFLP